MNNDESGIPKYWPYLAVFIGFSAVLLLELLSRYLTI